MTVVAPASAAAPTADARPEAPRRTAIALGIVAPGVTLPPGIHAARATAALAVALAPAASYATPRRRMDGCVAIHARTPAFLPWPPRSVMTPGAARRRAVRATASLSRALAEASHSAELALFLPLDAPPGAARAEQSGAPLECSAPQLSDGRDWLAARARARALTDAARAEAGAWLCRLARRLGADASPIADSRAGLSLSLRVSIAPPDRLAARVESAAAALGPLPTGAGRLLVTGPWPLFTFSCVSPA